MITISASISGGTELINVVKGLETRALEAAPEGLVNLAKKIVQEIKTHYVPVFVGRTPGSTTKGLKPIMVSLSGEVLHHKGHAAGQLRDSVGFEVLSESNFQVAMGAGSITREYVISIFAGKKGSGAEEYAHLQHENLMYRHKIGQAKYIEIPVMLLAPPELAQKVAKSVQTVMNAGL